MKIRSLLTVVAMLTALLFGVGTAYAVYGVDDAVPGKTAVIPVICSADSGTVDTGWAIADVLGIIDPEDTTTLGFGLHAVFHEPKNSGVAGDHHFCPTWNDVETDHCLCIMAGIGCGPGHVMYAAAPPAQTISGAKYWIGYVTYQQEQPAPACAGPGASIDSDELLADRLVTWVYLTDLPNGFASGFNAPSMEGPAEIGTELEENGSRAVAASRIFPRYVVQNNGPDTHTWWMLLFGRADLPTKVSGVLAGGRFLSCNIYDEEEGISSVCVSIPNEFNVFDITAAPTGAGCPGSGSINLLSGLFSPFPAAPPVCGVVSGTPCPGGPHNGYANCQILENDVFVGSALPVALTGTTDGNGAAPHIAGLLPKSTGQYSFFGWAHEKADGSSTQFNWDVVHPIHRHYCSPDNGGNSIIPNSPTDNWESCNCTGTGC